MPYASPRLRRLRVRAGIKPGRWAEQVEMSRGAYSLVENGHRSASEELFGRCAVRLNELLGVHVEAKDLMRKGRAARDANPRHTTAGGSPTETQEAEAAEAATTAEGRAAS